MRKLITTKTKKRRVDKSKLKKSRTDKYVGKPKDYTITFPAGPKKI